MRTNSEAISRIATRHGTRHEAKELARVLTDVREVLTKSDEIVEIIHLFGMENEGFLTEANVIDILNNLDYRNARFRDIFLQSTF